MMRRAVRVCVTGRPTAIGTNGMSGTACTVVLAHSHRTQHSGSGYNFVSPPVAHGHAAGASGGGGYYGSGGPSHANDNTAAFNYAGTSTGGGTAGFDRLPFISRGLRAPVNPSAFVERVPRNTVINIVPQGRQYVVERLGRYHRTLDPGWWFLIPFVDKIRYAYSVKEQGIEIPNQSAITCDNVMVEIDGVLFLRIVDTRKASYNIENPIYNLLNLAQTTMRSEIGRLDLDTLFRERASLNKNIVEVLRNEAADWGIECKRYEIRDITVSELVRRSMDLQADAERRKRQLILQSEGEAQAGINRAEGLRQAQRLAARAQRYTTVLRAEAEAAAIMLKSNAVARSTEVVAGTFDAASNPESCRDAVALRVAENYIEKFGELARRCNTVVLGGGDGGLPVSDPAAFTAKALSVFRTITASSGGSGEAPGGVRNSTNCSTRRDETNTNRAVNAVVMGSGNDGSMGGGTCSGTISTGNDGDNPI
uniref:Putative stomatin-like protein n=1 Tax=Trypanosoma congolense (strain IL3000) TaxID=1068625 RepID=G0UMC7_TRYCI|nr:putative stomatin-like protein [Trypanosoma congolense IL3000]